MTSGAPANHRLSVNAMCTFPWSFEQDIDLWQETGLKFAGLLMSKLGPDPADRMIRMAAAGITASTLITEPFDLGDPDSWDQTRARQRAAIDLMAKFGGLSIYFPPGRTTGAPWREDLSRLAEAVAPTVEHARANGVLASIEPSLRTSVSFVNTLRDAIDVAELTGLSIVADFGNMWMERDFREVVAQAQPHLALMQIGDMVIGSVSQPPPGGRAHIGEGELPLRRLLGDVLDAGYAGVFDVEVVPAEFMNGSDRATMLRGIAAASALLDEMGV